VRKRLHHFLLLFSWWKILSFQRFEILDRKGKSLATEPSRPPCRLAATRAERPAAAGLAATAAWFLAPVPPRRRPSCQWQGGGGPSFSTLSPQSSSPSRSRVCSPPMLGGGVRFCRWSVTPLWLCFSGSVGDAEATTLQRNNFSQLLPFSDGDLLRRQQRGWGDPSRSRGLAHRRLFQVMMLLTLLISRKMIFGGNLSIARLPVVESKDASWVLELADAPGRQRTRLICLAVSPHVRPPLCGVWLWCPTTIGKRLRRRRRTDR
jgi:hypothetical protein